MSQHAPRIVIDPADLELPPTQPLDVTHLYSTETSIGGSAA